MSDLSPNIQTTLVKIITDKPVRKTPYQVKGVFIKKHPDESITPMLDGTYRKKFSYPRVQVKILDEQIYFIGINEGVDPVLSIPDRFRELDFGNITFSINDFEVETVEKQFIPSGNIIKYSFVTPWAALNYMMAKKYRSLHNKKKINFLNKLLGKNLIFLAKEMGVAIDNGIYTKVKVHNLFPKSIDDNKWKVFRGEFKTNIVLPKFIGIGNGVTRGYGTIQGTVNDDMLVSDKELDHHKTKDMDLIVSNDITTQKKNRTKNKKTNKRISNVHRIKNPKYSKSNRGRNNNKSPNNFYNKNEHSAKSKSILSEDFDVIVDGNIDRDNNEIESNDDQRFNTEKHHKKQHKF